MIDIKELRRRLQAATPGPWIAAGPSFGESLPKYLNEVVIDRAGDEDDGYSICNPPIGLDEELSTDMAFIAAANPSAISELLDRLEAAESDALEQARLNGMGASREAALMAKLEAAEKERDALRARIEAMEKAGPVAWRTFDGEGGYDYRSYADNENYQLGWNARNPNHAGWVKPLYLAPSAQPAPSVPVDLITDYLVSISAHVAHQEEPQAQAEIGDLLRMLAAAPEAKP